MSSSIPRIFWSQACSWSFWMTFCSICLTLSLVTSNSSQTCSSVYLGPSIPYLILMIFASLSSSIANMVSRFCLRAFFSAYWSGLSVFASSIRSASVSLPSSHTSLSSDTFPKITSSSFLIFLIGKSSSSHISFEVGSLHSFWKRFW